MHRTDTQWLVILIEYEDGAVHGGGGAVVGEVGGGEFVVGCRMLVATGVCCRLLVAAGAGVSAVMTSVFVLIVFSVRPSMAQSPVFE